MTCSCLTISYRTSALHTDTHIKPRFPLKACKAVVTSITQMGLPYNWPTLTSGIYLLQRILV